MAKKSKIKDKSLECSIYDTNQLNFNLPNADGLKEEFLRRIGDKHLLTIGDAKNIPIGKHNKKTEYLIFMDGDEIGTLTRVVGGRYDNTLYMGRLPGYVNKSIERSKEDSEKKDVSRITLQETNGKRKDFHSLKFVFS